MLTSPVELDVTLVSTHFHFQPFQSGVASKRPKRSGASTFKALSTYERARTYVFFNSSVYKQLRVTLYYMFVKLQHLVMLQLQETYRRKYFQVQKWLDTPDGFIQVSLNKIL